MNSRKRSRLATVPILMLLIATSVATSATGAQRGKTAGGRVVVKRIDVNHGAKGMEIEITGSGPMRAITSRLSNPERLVIDVPDSIPDPELIIHFIQVDAPEIKAVRLNRVFQPGESITRVVVDLSSQLEVQVTSAPGHLSVKLRSAEPVQDAGVKAVKPDKTVSQGAVPAVTGIWGRRNAPPQDEKLKPDWVATARAAETKINKGVLEPGTPAVARRAETKVNAEKAEHDTPAVAAGPSRRAVQPETVTVEGMISRLPALSAVTAATAAPVAAEPLRSAVQPETVTVEGVKSRPRAMPAEMAAIPASPLQPAEEEKIEQAAPAAARAEEIDADLLDAKPAAPVAALGAGVTGKGKDATLGSDEEAAIKATLPADKRLPAPRNGEAPLPVALLLSGAATTGFYQESTSNGYVSHEASMVGSMRLDASGYIHSPGFLNFTVKPQGSVGRASSEGVFPDGEGISASATLFGGGAAPLTVSYHRLNRKLVTFGPLDRLAGLEADTSQDSLGANWKIRFPHLPELGLNYSDFSDSYVPLAALAPKTANSGRLLAADLTDKVLGWNLQTRYKLERSSQDLINIFDPTQAPYTYKRDNQELRASADRDFGQWLSTSLVAGTTKSRNEVQDRPFDQSFRFLSGNSFFRAGKKLTVGFRVGVTDNIVGATLASAVGGDGLTAAQPFLLIPTTARLQMISYSGSTQYALTKDLRVQADVLRETTSAPQNSIAASTSALTSLQASVAFVHRFRRWQFQSYYAANGGRFDYATTGSSRSSGQRANLGVTIGSLQSLELTAGVHGSLQDVNGNTYVHDRSAGANVSLSRSLWERWRLRASYDRERDQYKFSSTQYSSTSNGISVAVVHPLLELTASRNIRDGLTFQADPRLQFVPPDQGGLLLGAFPGTLVVPTGTNWSSAALSFHPAPKFTGRVAWLNSRQQLQGVVGNYYTEWEASVGYKFRSITLDAGYVSHDQNFAVDSFKRNRFFFRAIREFTFY
jgi:hypothetical protein